jgi:hypothetical protein
MLDPIKDLYNSLKSTKIFLDENDFRQQLTKSPKEVFDVVSREKQTSGLFLDYDDFESTTGLKKKEPSEVGGGAGTSARPSDSGKGFGGLKPVAKQPTQVFKEQGVGEDTMLARKMERAQRPAISTTGVRLPAAPKVVAEEKAAEKALAPKLPEAPKEDIGELEGLSNAIDRGILQGKLADMLALGQMPKREDIREIARINKELTQIPSTGAYQRFNTAPDLKTAAKEFIDNPFEITSQLISESLSALVRHGYSRAIAGAGTGAALGSLIPIPGISTAAGAGTGYIAGMGVAGYNLEMASSIMDSFREAGVDVTDEKSLTKAFDDPNTLRKAREFANKRAVPIAIFDMFSAGMGGKLLGKPAKTILSKVGRGAAEVGIQMGMAGAGETAAQLTAGQKINPTAILAEVIGEAGGGAPDIIVGTMIENKKNNQSIRKEAVRLDIEPQQLQDMLDISEASGEITDAQANEIKKEYEDIQKVKQAVPEEFKKNADVIEALEQKRQLEAKKQGLDPVFAKKIDDQIKALDTKIDDIVAAGEVAPKAAPEVPAAPAKVEPIRQLGTGANVYFENENYRVNDFRDKVLLNVSKVGDAGIVVNLEFNTPEEAVDVAKTLNRLYPKGVPEAVLLDKVVEDIKAGKYEEVAGEVTPEVPATEEKTYRVEYFDPESRKMTHQMFATEAEGEAFKKTLTREQTSQGVTSYFEKAPAKGVGEFAPEAKPQIYEFEGKRYEVTDKSVTEVETGNLLPVSKINKIRSEGKLVGEVAPEAALEAQKADIEKTKYGTISGSIPLSEALPNGVYVDLGNGLFAYADKNDKIAAIVDRDNNYIVSKSFWNAKEGKWQLPNKANLADDAKRLGVNQNEYIQKYQDTINALNEKGVGEKVAAPEVPAAPEKTQDEVAKEQTKETDLLLGGQAEQRRKDGKYTKDGVEYVRNPKGQGIASEMTGEVRFTNEVSLPFKYKLVEAETLQPSHQDGIRNPLHFIPEAQPKNRNDVGSLQAEESFANNPRFSELGENTNAYSGAPVVNERGEVVQGNNRSAGLRKGYQRNNPQYKNDLAANAEQFGFTREQVEGMKNPVLVREVAVSDQGAVELGNYDAKDLETGGKRRIDPIAVTRRMPFDVKGRIADLFTGEETLNQAIRANQKRLLELLNPYLNQAQRNTITKDGALTDAGIKDLEAVVQQFLFDNGDTALPDLFENLSATQKEGLRKSLPYVFSVSPEKSLVPDIQEAILAVNDFNASGAGEFDAWLLQGDIFNEGKTPKDKYTPLELAIAKTLVESKTQKEIAKKFADYADVVKDKEADMFEPARPGKSRKEGVLEIFKAEDYAKPISERGRKEAAPEKKPTPEPSAEKRAREAKREPRLPETEKRAEARKELRDAFNDLMNLGVVYDPRSQAEKQVRLTKAIINVIKQEAIGAIKDLKKYIKDNVGFDISDNDAKYLLIESKKPEYAIQEPAAGEVPVQPKARAGEKVEAGVPPTRPPKAPEEGKVEGEEEVEYTPREKEKALLNKLYKAKNIPEDAKIGFEKEGLKYQTKSQKEAELIANGVIDEIGIDDALELADSLKFDGDVNSLIYAESLNRLSKMEREAKSSEEKRALAKKFAEVGIEYGIKSQYGGRFNAAINYFYQKSPLGIVLMEDMKRKQEFDKFAKNKEQYWKEAHDIIKAELDALKLELESKKADPSIKTSEAKIMAARLKRAALKEKYKKGKGGGLTLTTGGLTKEGIEYVGELVATYIEEGIANVEVIVQRIFLDLKDVTAKDLDEKTANQVEEEVRKKYKETKGKSTLNKIRKKLEKLSKKKQDEVIRKSFNQIIESGGLDYDDFRKIIAETTGYPELTDQEKVRLEELVTKTNAVERMAEKAREDRTEQSLKDFRRAEMEAGKAARELNQLVWNKPDILKRLTSIMQLSTLGIPALINNPIYNIWNQATLRFPVGLINDLVDRGMTLAAQATGTEYQREYNAIDTQKEFFKKLGFGAKESVEQMITGLSRQDYIQKEVGGQQIQPLQAAKDWWASFTGKKKLTGAQLWDKAIQATVGVPAEAIARTLNIGDKPQRFAAEGAQASAFAKSFGLKDLDYKLFIEFPREEAFRIYKSKGLSDAEAAQKAEYIKDVILKEGQRATFQQDNLLNTAISALFNTIFGKGKETGLANLVKTVTVSPYIKIPANAYWSYYNLVNPEIALLQSFVHGGRAFYLNKSGEKNQAKLALRESRYWLAHSITGMAMKAVVIALVKAAVYNPGSDEEESKREREGKAFFEGQGTINIDKLNAVLAGEDPTQVKNGLLIPNRWFGQWGTVGNAIARKYENMTPEQRKNEADYYDFMLGELSTDVLQEMEQGVFANTSSLLSLLQTGNPNRYLTNTLNMFTNIVHPAAIAQISRAEIPNFTTQKADSFLKELENAMLTRSSFLRDLTGKYPPSKIGIWGEPIAKQGGTVQKLFNITRVNKDMFARPLYDDAKKYNDINFFPPAVTSSLNGKQLTVTQTRALQEFVGQARKARIAPYINDSAIIEGFSIKYSDLKDPEDKKKVLNYLYEMGRRDGLEKFYNQYKDLKPEEKTEDFLKELQFDLFKTLQKYK